MTNEPGVTAAAPALTEPVPEADQPKPPERVEQRGRADEVEQVELSSAPGRTLRGNMTIWLRNPFLAGFLVTLGGLLAYWLGGAISSLATVMVSISVAIFISLALEPIVNWLTRHKMSRPLAITVVILALALVIGGLLAVIIPIAVDQIGEFAQSVPSFIQSIEQAGWFKRVTELSGQPELFNDLLDRARTWLSNPQNVATVTGGALAVGTGVVTVLATSLIVLVLTLYFTAALPTMKQSLVRLAPAYSRPSVERLTTQLSAAVGSYVGGMAVLAVCNAVFSLILLFVLKVPFAALLAVLALFITMIPMVGSVAFWILASSMSLLTIGWTGFIFVGVYFAYMQVEAYLMTPKVMTKAVQIPGSLVLISAMVGGTLLGLLGALVAVPVTASLLTIIKEIVIPRQDAKLTHEH